MSPGPTRVDARKDPEADTFPTHDMHYSESRPRKLLDVNFASFTDLFEAKQIPQTTGFGPSKNGGLEGLVSPHFSGPFPGTKKRFLGKTSPKKTKEGKLKSDAER